MFVGSRAILNRLPEDIKIKVGSSEISPLNSVKDLGVILDPNLSFDKHVDNICTKANGLLFFLSRHKMLFDNQTRKTVIEALVTSLFSYCSVIWGGCNKTIKSKVQKTQNFAAKVAVGYGRKRDHATPFLNILEWLNIKKQLTYQDLLFIFKVVNGYIPDSVLSISIVGDTHDRLTRQSNNLHIPRRNTKIADNALSIRGSLEWNKLPETLKNEQRMSTFKREVKKYLCTR